MKSEVSFDEKKNIINVVITDNNRTLDDIQKTAKQVQFIQQNSDSTRIFYDHSTFRWKFDYLNEYKLAKQFDKLLPFHPESRVAFYLGEYYVDKYWNLMRKIIRENTKVEIEYFGDLDEAYKWLMEK